MSDKSRSSSTLAVCAILLLCAGAGAWYVMDGGSPVQEKATQPVAESIAPVSVSTVLETSAPADEAVSSKADTGQASGALNSEPRPRQLSAEEKQDARVEKALAAKERMQGGDSEGGALSEASVQPARETKDAVVTPQFVSDLARWMANNYKPSGKGKNVVSLRTANARYSISPLLRSAERDAIKGRQAVLRYVYSPGMLEALYRIYGESFQRELESFAHHGQSLGQEQIAAMFRFYGRQFKELADALGVASTLDIKALVKPIRQATAREEAASEEFGKAYAAHSEARDAGQKEAMAKYSERMVQSIRAASEADASKERARHAVVKAMKQGLGKTSLPDADLLFIAEWLERRNASKEAIEVSSSICRRLAESMEQRAAELLGSDGTPLAQ